MMPDNGLPKFGQIYFYEPEEQVGIRHGIMDGLSQNLIRRIQNILFDINPYVQQFRAASEFILNNPTIDLRLVLFLDTNKDKRTHNLPSVNEVAAIISGTDQDRVQKAREIYLYKKNVDENNILQIISDSHTCYDPLHYVLMHPYGEQGWAPNVYLKYQAEQQVDVTTQQIENNNYFNNNNNQINLIQTQNNNNTLIINGSYNNLVSNFTEIENEDIPVISYNQEQINELDYSNESNSILNNNIDSNSLFDQNIEYEDDGFDYGDDVNISSHQSKYVSCCEFYSAKLMRLSDDSSVFHLFGRLYQQYIVDNYLKVEHQKLKWLMFNQDKLRVELYKGLN